MATARIADRRGAVLSVGLRTRGPRYDGAKSSTSGSALIWTSESTCSHPIRTMLASEEPLSAEILAPALLPLAGRLASLTIVGVVPHVCGFEYYGAAHGHYPGDDAHGLHLDGVSHWLGAASSRSRRAFLPRTWPQSRGLSLSAWHTIQRTCHWRSAVRSTGSPSDFYVRAILPGRVQRTSLMGRPSYV